MSERKLVSVQTISNIRPIPGLDNIDCASVLGWTIVVQKNFYTEGQKIAFFEVDSFLSEHNPVFKEKCGGWKKYTMAGNNDVTVDGFVVKARKIRGIVSQGFVLSLEELGFSEGEISSIKVGLDISNRLGVQKWVSNEEKISTNQGNIIGNYDRRFAPKTDSPRVQTLAEHWDEIVKLRWIPTVKVDGSSRTIVNDNDTIRLFSRNKELSTENAVEMAIAEENDILHVLKENPGMAIQAELCGPKVNGNRLKLLSHRLFVFAVWQNGRKVSRENWDERLLKTAAPELPDRWLPTGVLEGMVMKVSKLKNNVSPGTLDEGVVYHLAGGQDTPSWLDDNVSFKIISTEYLLQHKL